MAQSKSVPVKKLVAKNGVYLDPKTGEEKVRWLTCGRVLQNGDKTGIVIDCLPAAPEPGSLFFYCFDLDDEAEAPKKAAPKAASDPFA